MTDQTPQHPRNMNLQPGDVISYVQGGIGHTVGRGYTVTATGRIPNDEGLAYLPSQLWPTSQFILVSRADDGWVDQPSPFFRGSNFDYRRIDGQWSERARKPKIERVPAYRGLTKAIGDETGFVTMTDGVLDWSTFSDKEGL